MKKLYISPQHVSDPYVMAFMDQLEHKGIDYEVVLASMTEIKTLYQASASRGMKALVENPAPSPGGGVHGGRPPARRQ
ncbi:hypothetical protein [Pseudomonas sp. PCH44]|uniref:hypothetical protein n=1 Tax=Pseudomonas sp. PCH44 TaxID=2800904 RepID=UPI0020166540|nr:hypothetical protein [Pseudomonas sp. PCH44]